MFIFLFCKLIFQNCFVTNNFKSLKMLLNKLNIEKKLLSERRKFRSETALLQEIEAIFLKMKSKENKSLTILKEKFNKTEPTAI